MNAAEATRAEDRRRAPREKTFTLAVLSVAGIEYRAHVLDVGSRGARIHCVNPLRVGQFATIRGEGFEGRCTVRWVHADGKAGLQFAP